MPAEPRVFGRARWLVPALILVTVAGVRAESLGLEEAMILARDQAHEVAAATSRARARGARLDEARGYRLPTVSLSEVWTRTDSPADVFGLLLNQERFSFQEFVQSDPNDPDYLENAVTRLEMSLPVYTGGELSARIEQAEKALEAAEDESSRTGDEVAFRAGESYLRLLQARERVELMERAVETVEAHVDLARAYVDEGMIVTSELLRAEVEAARLRDELASARSDARVAEAVLSFRLGVRLDSGWELEPVDDPSPIDGKMMSWLDRADERADLEAARTMVAVAELEARVARAKRLPRIGFTARYDLYDEDPFGTDGDNTTLMAAASIDLFAGGRHRAAETAAEAEAEAVARDVERMAEGIRLEVRQAFLEAGTARQRLATARSALDAAREAERITEERFREGVVKMIDLLDATTARIEAETRENVARADAHLAELRLVLASGLAPEEALGPREGAPVQEIDATDSGERNS